jgi:hypothetical protein
MWGEEKAGLSPGLSFLMDGRVEPGHDGEAHNTLLLSFTLSASR